MLAGAARAVRVSRGLTFTELKSGAFIPAVTLPLALAVSGPQTAWCLETELLVGRLEPDRVLTFLAVWLALVKSLGLFESQRPHLFGAGHWAHLPSFWGGFDEKIHGTNPGPESDKPQGLCSSFETVSSLDHDAESGSRGLRPVRFRLNRNQPWSEAGLGPRLCTEGQGLVVPSPGSPLPPLSRAGPASSSEPASSAAPPRPPRAEGGSRGDPDLPRPLCRLLGLVPRIVPAKAHDSEGEV